MPKGFDVEHMAQAPERDGVLLASLFLLVGAGLAALWSASSGYALSLGKDASFFMLKQARYMPFALALFILCALCPLDRIRAYIGPITIIALLSLLLPFIPVLGENRNGASRWIDLRVATFQPSEMWKPVSVLYLAHYLDKRRDELDGKGISALVAPLLIIFIGAFLILMQNDFSTAVIAGVAALSVLWVSGVPLLFFLGLIGIIVPLGALSVLTSDFRLRRILAFLYPAYEPHGQSYQVLGSIRAVTAGGLFGKGIGLGTLKLGSVPEVQSDFVFAAYAEEMGFMGVVAFFALWAVFAWRCYSRAFAETDSFRAYLGIGLITLLVVEVLVNVAMAAGVIPATGIPLPFFSAGGTSLLASCGIAGLLVNLARPSTVRGASYV